MTAPRGRRPIPFRVYREYVVAVLGAVCGVLAVAVNVVALCLIDRL